MRAAVEVMFQHRRQCLTAGQVLINRVNTHRLVAGVIEELRTNHRDVRQPVNRVLPSPDKRGYRNVAPEIRFTLNPFPLSM